MISKISVLPTRRSRLSDVDFSRLEFGKYTSDHMLVCDYDHGEWKPAQILPYANLSMSPATLALHYGQTVFEGMKALRMDDGRINIFRMHKHYERFVRSLDRMCMSIIPRETFVEGLKQLVELDQEWIPNTQGSALYLRPFMYASEARYGIKVSEQYRFVIFTGPVPQFYSQPVKIKVERQFTRASAGGTGFAKCGGNYGAAYYPTELAKRDGYDQVLWTDGRDHQFIEESGMMNAMFVIENKLVTPPVSDSILDGITRDSLLTIAVDMGYVVEERPLSIFELEKAFQANKITEAFGTGTAAVIAPISKINLEGKDFNLPEYNHENLMFQLKRKLEDIRAGRCEDLYDWNFIF